MRATVPGPWQRATSRPSLRNVVLLCGTLVQLAPAAAAAQTELTSEGYETVVSASRNEQRRFDAPRSVETVDRERLDEMQGRAVPESLGETTGVHVQQTNRGAGAPIIRGLVGPQNLIVIDGVRFNTSTFRTGPNQYLATVDPFAIERLEVVRGPSSVLYGDGAMGGVIQVVTASVAAEHGELAAAGEGAAWAGSADDSYGAALRVTAGKGDFALRLGGSFSRFGILEAGDGVTQLNSDYDTGSWHAKAVYRRGPSLDVTAVYLGTAIRDAGRVDGLGRGDVRFYDNDDHLGYIALRWKGEGMVRRVRATVSLHRLRERVRRLSCETEDGVVVDRDGCAGLDLSALTRKRRYDDTVLVLGASGSARLGLLPGRLWLDVGVEGYRDGVRSSAQSARADSGFAFTRLERGNFSDGSTYRTAGLFVHAEGTILDLGGSAGILRGTGGGRVSSFAAQAPDVPGLSDVEYDHTGVVGSAGLQWLVAETSNLYLSFVQGFRAPNLQETTVLGDTGSKLEVPNGELGPERSDTLELGAKLELGPVAATGAWFHSWIGAGIDEKPATYEGQDVVDGKPVVQRVNADHGTYSGIEGGLSLRLWRLHLQGGLTWMRGELTEVDAQGVETTHPARRVPPLFGRAGLRYNDARGRGYAEVFVAFADQQTRLHPSDKKDLRICELGLYSGVLKTDCRAGRPGWSTLNLRAGWRIQRSARVELAVYNLTDRRYRLHGSGVLGPGLDARLRVSASF